MKGANVFFDTFELFLPNALERIQYFMSITITNKSITVNVLRQIVMLTGNSAHGVNLCNDISTLEWCMWSESNSKC